MSFRWPCHSITLDNYIWILIHKLLSERKTRLRSKLDTDDRIKNDRPGCFVSDTLFSRSKSRIGFNFRKMIRHGEVVLTSHPFLHPRQKSRLILSSRSSLSFFSLSPPLSSDVIPNFQRDAGGPIRPQDREPRTVSQLPW